MLIPALVQRLRGAALSSPSVRLWRIVLTSLELLAVRGATSHQDHMMLSSFLTATIPIKIHNYHRWAVASLAQRGLLHHPIIHLVIVLFFFIASNPLDSPEIDRCILKLV